MMRKKNHCHQGNANTLGSGDWGLWLTRHMSTSLQAVIDERSTTHNDLSPLCVLMLYFTSVIFVLLTKSKRY